MWKSLNIAMVLLATAGFGVARAEAQLTAEENRWLSAGSAVLDYAEGQRLPIDIIVQPRVEAGAVALAMGFDGGRCKLVFSLRGNPNAESVLAGLAPGQARLAIELMVAHEVAHCWRHVNGAVQALPAGFSAAAGGKSTQDRREMLQTRREEGFADVVALAWVQRAHPQQYAQLQSWLERVRGEHAKPGSHHDTHAWVVLARVGSVFEDGTTLFEQARIFECQHSLAPGCSR